MRFPRLLLVVVLACAQGALAISVGGKLYVSSKDALLLKEPKAKAAKVDTLQPGTEVVWLGVSEKNKQYHQVQVGSTKGFVLLSALTPNKPQSELDAASGKPMSPPAFAASGAANKDGPRASTYRSQSPALQAAAAELIYVEELNKRQATPEALAAKNKSLHAP